VRVAGHKPTSEDLSGCRPPLVRVADHTDREDAKQPDIYFAAWHLGTRADRSPSLFFTRRYN